MADPWRVPGQLAEWAGPAVVAGVALWLFFGALDPTTSYLQDRWGGQSLLLMIAGWLPVGGLLSAAAFVALRHGWLARRGRHMATVEENLYGAVGLVWGGFAMLMMGKQGLWQPYEPERVVAHVALTSEAVAGGVAAGGWALLLTGCLAAAYALGRVAGLRGPGWPVAWTVASWLFGGTVLSLAQLVLAHRVS